jgi:Cu2+-exporting ATPase
MPSDAFALKAPAPADRSVQTADCWHCASPVPAAMFDPEVREQFCCSGCRTAYGIIHDCGLEEYYALRRELEVGARPAVAEGATYEEMDDPAFTDLYVRVGEGGEASTLLLLEGVHCGACVWLVERLPLIAPGVVSARLNLTRASLEVRWRPEAVRLSTIARTLDRLGYPPHPLSDAGRKAAAEREDRRQLARLAVAGACAGNNMLVALALYAGAFSGMSAEHTELFRWTSALLGITSLAWPGSVFFRGAWAALRTRTTHLDVPLALGLGAGGIAGAANTVRGSGDVYFDSLSVLVFFLLAGRWVQFRQQRRAADSVGMLRSVTPRRATRWTPDGFRTIPVEGLRVGDLLLVGVGDVLPADGVVAEGETAVDESILTGESMGRAVRIGDAVFAGATNLTAPIQFRASAVGTQTRMGRLMQSVEDAALVRAPIVNLANRISGVFVAVVVTLAIATAVYWRSVGSPYWLEHAVALLVVSCPCSLGLATPLAIAVAQGRAARRSILVKGGEAIERLGQPGRVWLDKTGTLTEGRMKLRRWFGSAEALAVAAALERHAAHPVAQALVDAAAGEEQNLLQVKDFRQIAGAGATGRVEGDEVLVGSPEFLRRCGVDCAGAWERSFDAMIEEGLTAVGVSINGELAAVAGVGDEIRSDAAAAVRELAARGWCVGVLSGDNPKIVRQVAGRVGIDEADALGGLSPEEKRETVRRDSEAGTVVMVGDGVNDSAALAVATVGVAVKGGAEASLQAAQVYLARGGLRPLVELVEGSRRALRVVYANFAIALCYNAAAIGLAMAGWINPLTAAVLMPISSLTVVALSVAGPSFRRSP